MIISNMKIEEPHTLTDTVVSIEALLQDCKSSDGDLDDFDQSDFEVLVVTNYNDNDSLYFLIKLKFPMYSCSCKHKELDHN